MRILRYSTPQDAVTRETRGILKRYETFADKSAGGCVVCERDVADGV